MPKSSQRPDTKLLSTVRMLGKFGPAGVLLAAVTTLLGVAVSVGPVCQPLPKDAAVSNIAGPVDTSGPSGSPGSVFLAFWNVENLFDDQDDPNVDDDLENWFASDPGARQFKLNQLAEAVIRMNHNRGPDILATCEIESRRAAEALRDVINAKFSADGREDLLYHHVVFEPSRDPRKISPAILTRLKVEPRRSRQFGPSPHFRTLEAHLLANGHPLVLMVAHWTSRGTDRTGERRGLYGDACQGRVREICTANPSADIIVCGDFNDEPTDPSVRERLNAWPNESDVLVPWDRKSPVRLLNLCARFDTTREGTIEYRGKWYLFDHICVSPGMLDRRGWWCRADAAAIFNPAWMLDSSGRKPIRFGSRNSTGPRGYADHLPVTAVLQVQNP